MADIPTTHQALTGDGPGVATVKTSHPVPKLRDDYILVKVYAVALNPTDWKTLAGASKAGLIIGCDFSGVVVAVGSKVTKPFKPGDRIAGFAHGSNLLNEEDGAFAEYVVAKGDTQILIPDTLSFEEAATLGVGVITVGQGLVKSLGLPTPENPSKDGTSVLIYGGSTATGTLAIQIAKQAGLHVITTTSKKNFDLVKSLGADEVFDYTSPTVAQDINAATGNSLQYAFDTVSTDDTVIISYNALSTTKDARYTSLLGQKKGPREISYSGATLAYTFKGEDLELFGMKIPGSPEEFEFAKKWINVIEKLLAEGKLKAHPQDIRDGGLAKIHEGLDDLKNNKVSGKKIVYRLN